MLVGEQTQLLTRGGNSAIAMRQILAHIPDVQTLGGIYLH